MPAKVCHYTFFTYSKKKNILILFRHIYATFFKWKIHFVTKLFAFAFDIIISAKISQFIVKVESMLANNKRGSTMEDIVAERIYGVVSMATSHSFHRLRCANPNRNRLKCEAARNPEFQQRVIIIHLWVYD